MSLSTQLNQLGIMGNQEKDIIDLVNDSKDYNTFIAKTPTGIRSFDNRINRIVEQHYKDYPRPSGGRKRKSRRNRKSKKARKSRRKSTRRR